MEYKMSRSLRSNLITYGIVVLFFVVCEILIATHILSYSLQGQLVPICAYVCMAISLNLVVGISGELSLGHAGFMSIGAFSGVVAAALVGGVAGNEPAILVISMLVGGLLAGVMGFLISIPVMRLHGDYLAIVTLAFGEIIKNILNNLYVGMDESGLHFSMNSESSLHMSQAGKVLLAGPKGAVGVNTIASFIVGILLVLFCLFVALNLINSRSGRAILAVRDNRIAAEACGINSMKYRMMAFVVSAVLAGMAGALYGLNYSSFIPSKFDFNNSIMVLVFVVLGGIGNIRGGMIAAAVLTVLPEALRFLSTYRMLIYSVVLIAVMLISNNEQARMVLRRFKNHFKKSRKKKVAPQVAVAGAGAASAKEDGAND
ncbi:branched-chain amino acid ABC transporter permease [Atopobium sp. oral taxon 810]|uniref:branched-chain amino acid ABC transporter permease n=1 Tax=Atopobium sp. oral taxon 810 TaxID=712158 RepID=UPI000396A329|nr:branched-chain amino acid ABC transporter permease [Atopobium sp. oral taxon 810]ERI05660.1 branched-chain amino acid ABC transporter, permease protein [Atopobium sp. oral taxon 810 str. F0209]